MIELLKSLSPIVVPFVILLELGMFGLVLDMRQRMIRMETKTGLCEECPRRSAPVSVPVNPPEYNPYWMNPVTSSNSHTTLDNKSKGVITAC